MLHETLYLNVNRNLNTLIQHLNVCVTYQQLLIAIFCLNILVSHNLNIYRIPKQ